MQNRITALLSSIRRVVHHPARDSRKTLGKSLPATRSLASSQSPSITRACPSLLWERACRSGKEKPRVVCAKPALTHRCEQGVFARPPPALPPPCLVYEIRLTKPRGPDILEPAYWSDGLMVGLRRTLTRGLGMLSLVEAGGRQPPQARTPADTRLAHFWDPRSELRDSHLPGFPGVGSCHCSCRPTCCHPKG